MATNTDDQLLLQEMARTLIRERLLGMPREARADGGPFRDVRRVPH